MDRFAAQIMIFGGATLLALIGYTERQVRNFYLSSLRARVVNAALEDSSLRDALTGLENRRGLAKALDALQAQGPRGRGHRGRLARYRPLQGLQ